MLVSPDGRLKVNDFGMTRALASISPEERSEVVWGSPHYFSRSKQQDYAFTSSDVYSLV
jgi:serine/threonine-protein kinase